MRHNKASSDSDVDIDLEYISQRQGQGITEGAESQQGVQIEDRLSPLTVEDEEPPTLVASNPPATQVDRGVQPRRNPLRAREKPHRYR